MYGGRYPRGPSGRYGSRHGGSGSDDRPHCGGFGRGRRYDDYTCSDDGSDYGSPNGSEDSFHGGLGGRRGSSRGYGGRSARPPEWGLTEEEMDEILAPLGHEELHSDDEVRGRDRDRSNHFERGGRGPSRGDGGRRTGSIDRFLTEEELDAILDPLNEEELPLNDEVLDRDRDRSNPFGRARRGSRQESPFGTQYEGGRRLSSVSPRGGRSPPPFGRGHLPSPFGRRRPGGYERGSRREASAEFGGFWEGYQPYNHHAGRRGREPAFSGRRGAFS